MNSTITPDLLARYFSGNCAGEEEVTVGAWLLESPAHAVQAEVWLGAAGQIDLKTFREILEGRAETRDRLMKSIIES